MTTRSQDFATAVLLAFESNGLNTDVEVSAAGGPSNTWMTNLRKAKRGEVELAEPRSDTYRRIDQAARWLPGSARALFTDGKVPNQVPSGAWGHIDLVAQNRAGRIVMTEAKSPAVIRRADELPPVTFVNLDQYFQELVGRIIELEDRVEALEGGNDELQAQRQLRNAIVHGRPSGPLSDATGRPDVEVAADDQEQSISGEQEQPTEP